MTNPSTFAPPPAAASVGGRKRGLGMGISALLASGAPTPYDLLRRVPTDQLHPSPLQPRRHFADAELATLAESLRAQGVLQPLVVRERDGETGYEIVAGERRWRAALLVGLDDLPVLVRTLSDGDVLQVALVENLQREDLNALEEAQAYRNLMEAFGHTQEMLAGIVGRSRSHVANTLRLLALPEVIQDLVGRGRLSAGHARALVGHPAAEALAVEIVRRGLTVREAEELARRYAREAAAANRPPKPPTGSELTEVQSRLARGLGLKVAVRGKPRAGSLTIRWSDTTQLDLLINRLISSG